mmetsp:Transcript_18807/g.56389  ORF Transcript_18807/g.56389 Transcript_18807/m.56389 type:complete len:229 (+) Transcript_18807:2254-2940(+)
MIEDGLGEELALQTVQLDLVPEGRRARLQWVNWGQGGPLARWRRLLVLLEFARLYVVVVGVGPVLACALDRIRVCHARAGHSSHAAQAVECAHCCTAKVDRVHQHQRLVLQTKHRTERVQRRLSRLGTELPAEIPHAVRHALAQLRSPAAREQLAHTGQHEAQRFVLARMRGQRVVRLVQPVARVGVQAIEQLLLFGRRQRRGRIQVLAVPIDPQHVVLLRGRRRRRR